MDTELVNILSLGIVGTAFTFLISWLKKVLRIEGAETKFVVVILAFILGLVFYFVRELNLWGAFTTIIMISQTVYGLFVKE